jgi:hypothetical protein
VLPGAPAQGKPGAAGLNAPAATGYDPWRDDAPELARTMAASVQLCITFGERAGQQVRRIGAGFGAEGEAPTLTGPRCASVQGFSLHANTQVPYGGCLAPHSHLRGAIIPTPRQQGMADEAATDTTSPRWSWTSYHLSTPIWRLFTSP